MCGVKAKLLPPQPFFVTGSYSSRSRQNGSMSLPRRREGAKQKFRTGRGKLGDATRKVVVERVLVRNALSGIWHHVRLLPGVAPLLVHSSAHLLEVRACRGWQRVLRDHGRRTECHAMDDPCISIFTTVDGAEVNCDSPEDWERAGKSMEASGSNSPNPPMHRLLTAPNQKDSFCE